ncbi:proprotein convertase subtilisin/kexin type 4-like isoform X3 [Euwallacea fornicatus]|uniref:proprotein convertase subtilisin/kexin type 4-like isoform X3 n=1 Tax=Euwallacea fornicatus TaxID=995702 RepID=UPI003390696A
MTMKVYFNLVCVVTIIVSCIQFTPAHYTQQWAVHIPGGLEVATQVARDHGFLNHGLIFEDHYFFSHYHVAKRSLYPNSEKKIRLAADTRVLWASQQLAKKRSKRDMRLQNSDPKWGSMWYLNRGDGFDMNVIPAWLDGVTGKGAVVTILDDGLEKDHPDLVKNYDPLASYDVNNQDSDPSPRYDMIDSNRHGTRCAGEVAATSNNSICALGVAHGAQVGGVRMLDGDVTDAVEARSLSLNPQHIDIYSASWGPDDDGKTVDGPGELATRAFIEGVTKGRSGKGSIFVWASGNGGRDHDNCNCDGYTNSIYSLSISSATEHGNVPWYSEACSSTLASTYSSGAVTERQVVTTDLRHACTSSHTGTSASAPLAAGICALALEANPNLTWRDMQHIVVRTARPQHLTASDWQVNGVGRNVSHSFGYGLMDAYAMVLLARNWITVPEQHKCEVSAPEAAKPIPAKSSVLVPLEVTECEGVENLEHVQAKLTIYAQRRGDLKIQLTSPMGTKVTLLAKRDHDNSRSGFNNWPFMSVHSWGESPLGTWKLEIHNDGRLMGRASLQNWSLVLYGTKQFLSFSSITNESAVSNKNKPSRVLNKKIKSKQKILQKIKNQRQPVHSIKSAKVSSKAKPRQMGVSKGKYSVASVFNNTVSSVILKNKSKSLVASSTTSVPSDFSPYFYAISNSKLKLSHENMVKHYLKFVKNVTITYPVMIPARDSTEKKNFKKSQKLKEKSRDVNFSQNIKPLIPNNAEKSSTSKETKAHIKLWDLTLYGTATPPAYDSKQTEGGISISEVYKDVLDNSIDNSPNWKGGAENRKDTLEVEETEKSTSSSCRSGNGNFCLECNPDYFMHNWKCIRSCPPGFYDSRNDLNRNSEDSNLPSNAKCLPCHYSCMKCRGSMDYQCAECFGDAFLYNRSRLENYCYPSHMMSDILSEKWYFIVVLVVIGCSMLLLLLAFLYYKKRPSGYDILRMEEDNSKVGALN